MVKDIKSCHHGDIELELVEILTEEDRIYDVICTAVGTGGTISGIINASKKHQKVIGFPALKGDFLQNEIQKYILNIS